MIGNSWLMFISGQPLWVCLIADADIYKAGWSIIILIKLNDDKCNIYKIVKSNVQLFYTKITENYYFLFDRAINYYKLTQIT